MRARFIKEVGTRAYLRIYWDACTVTSVEPCNECPNGHMNLKDQLTCPNSYGGGKPGYHNAKHLLGTTDKVEDFNGFGKISDYPAERWPTVCDHCGAPVPKDAPPQRLGENGVKVHHQVFTERLYDTASGKPERGDIYAIDWHRGSECPYWDNCDGVHLYVILPDGGHWDINSRASNCDKKDERTHRCWVKHGTPPNLTVDKNGHTCGAGAGSIMSLSGWHGFLRDGVFA